MWKSKQKIAYLDTTKQKQQPHREEEWWWDNHKLFLYIFSALKFAHFVIYNAKLWNIIFFIIFFLNSLLKIIYTLTFIALKWDRKERREFEQQQIH